MAAELIELREAERRRRHGPPVTPLPSEGAADVELGAVDPEPT